MRVLLSGVDEVAIPEDRSFAILIVGGEVMVDAPLGSPDVTTIQAIAGTSWSSPALSPDGMQLLLASADTYVWRAIRTGMPTSWTAPTHTSLATTIHPGAMGRAAVAS